MLSSVVNLKYKVLNPQPKHFAGIQELCKKVYPFSKPWSLEQLESHRAYFPEGQLVVLDVETNRVVAMAFSLIIYWDDYLTQDSWKDFTASGSFSNHNPRKGKTLYGAEVMVDPELRGQGIGKMLYEARKQIVKKFKLKRIRAGARLRGYGKVKEQYSATEYVKKVIEKKIYDPTLSFQISQGFEVIDVAPNYLFNDPESVGFAAVIEWLNPEVATAKDYQKQQQSKESLLLGHKFSSEHLPVELKRLVRKATFVLGDIIKDFEGEDFFDKIEFYRDQLKKTRIKKNQDYFKSILVSLQKEKKEHQLKIAHAFSLQLELVNVCESAYRTWRLRSKSIPQIVKSKLHLTYVLTAHPTEARSKDMVDVLNSFGELLIDALQNNFTYNENELASRMRMLWLCPTSKTIKPTVLDEAEYIYSLIFSDKLFDFILADKPSYDLKLRAWVGGDKDGHPDVNKDVMLECFVRSRKHLIIATIKKFEEVISDAKKIERAGGVSKVELKNLEEIMNHLSRLFLISAGDGARIKAWIMKYKRFLASAHIFIRKHSQIILINRTLEMFPALVFPIELREDSSLIKEAIGDKKSLIRGMLSELRKISGALGVHSYARGFIISNCESVEDITAACELVYSICGSHALPVIPLFETKEALVAGKKITKNWLTQKKNKEIVSHKWNNTLEIMLGYSDSSKQMGVLASRFMISKAMLEIEKTIKSFGVVPYFFHGSGGSVARGGGSLKEQIAWWPNSAIANPKLTIQGEMIQRKFASQEILNSQCVHLVTEAMKRKGKSSQQISSKTLETFAASVSKKYIDLVNDQGKLKQLLEASPYNYLDLLKIGSRPSKRPQHTVSVNSLRAIPWVLCWTQTRLLMPTWWGVGAAWKELDSNSKKELQILFSTNPFFSSFVKTMGFTLSKVELGIWKMYFKDNQPQELIKQFEQEYSLAIKFVHDITQEKELIWYRPWLKESIQLRAANIHILNMLQIISFASNDEILLRETLVGIACGMLTTG